MEVFNELVSSLGFPIACVVCLGLFIYKMYNAGAEEKKALMEANEKREARLESEITENRKIIANAIETLALYADRLSGIEKDIEDIKVNITSINENLKND